MTSSEHELLQNVLPRYEIRSEIGRGGWGVVYEGWHRDLQRPVAIKQLPHQLGSDPTVRDRFIAEAQRVASLEHPHIVPVYDFAERDGLYVIVMELASGGTVWQRFTSSGMRTDEAIGTVLAAAAGLHHAHSRGLLHRDVKPDNLLYSASGTAKIADFGIAKSMTATQAGRAATEGVIGTPAYMAPEQVTGGSLSAATDVYALASVLYELLSGHLPFAERSDAIALLFQRVHEPPRPLRSLAPGVAQPIASVIDRALHLEPAERPATAEQFAVELAAATTQSFGAGWLERSAITVMGSTSVIAATERTSAGPYVTDGAASTVVMHPGDTARLRLGTQAAPATSPDQQHDATAPETAPGDRPSRRPAVLALAAVLLAVAIGIAVMLAGGNGAITASERAAFVEQCRASQVAPDLCACAADRGIDQLDADMFRDSLTTMLEEQGTLSADFKELFDSCVADGF